MEKISTGGYMLLDGHHRWLAARRLHVKKVPITILNVTPIESIRSAVAASERRMCVSFDLDEVLLADGVKVAADQEYAWLAGHFIHRRLRKNAPALIRELHDLGFDVWVYTGSYISEPDLHKLFRMYNSPVDGIVNGTRRPEERKILRQIFTEKYDVSLHIDTVAVVWVNTRTRDFDTVPLDKGTDTWGAQALQVVKQIGIVKDMLNIRKA